MGTGTTDFISKHVRAFFRESTGRFFAMAAIGIFSLIVTGSIAPHLLSLIIGLAMFSTFSLTLSVFFKLNNKDKNRMSTRIETLEEKYENMEETLTGKISLLEHYTPYAIAEFVLPDSVFVHSNTNWLSVTGWKISELNEILLDAPIEKRSELVSTLLYSDETQDIVKNILYARISGDTTPKRISNAMLKHKSGKSKPITIQTHLLKKERQRSLYQLFITDESVIKDLIESIEIQNTTFKGMLSRFSHVHDEKGEMNNYIQQMQEITQTALKNVEQVNDLKLKDKE